MTSDPTTPAGALAHEALTRCFRPRVVAASAPRIATSRLHTAKPQPRHSHNATGDEPARNKPGLQHPTETRPTTNTPERTHR
ncbi:hypothetical protein IU436_27400 [Nocardia farcinica]|uniref:hypothetical protein n=1 Tax=Nocardia TaxID=1817 RepID=UPI001896161A|nr:MULTISPECIES: hypothetical protein [Nocardia]MBF6215662.1 hypothetical protein [Nocardia puris]MBF6422367.1 hypothetical protein [Nocardia farcinica]MBF6434068.1 hypothetical protein [Nocardia farcinica]MBF6505124.1 hypothetical protein [Nocardia farcinica]